MRDNRQIQNRSSQYRYRFLLNESTFHCRSSCMLSLFWSSCCPPTFVSRVSIIFWSLDNEICASELISFALRSLKSVWVFVLAGSCSDILCYLRCLFTLWFRCLLASMLLLELPAPFILPLFTISVEVLTRVNVLDLFELTNFVNLGSLGNSIASLILLSFLRCSNSSFFSSSKLFSSDKRKMLQSGMIADASPKWNILGWSMNVHAIAELSFFEAWLSSS